uniref:Uncharacterized protein n=1 Tax=Catharus ustulatus TaxID=91951 RepID=A0A8C3UH87_CATUS
MKAGGGWSSCCWPWDPALPGTECSALLRGALLSMLLFLLPSLALVAIPACIGALGFTGAGIAAGSIAAKMMSAAAIANGGGVAAGSTVAVLQSVGEWRGQGIGAAAGALSK